MGLCGSCWGDEVHSSKYSKFWSIVLGSSCPIPPTFTRRNIGIASQKQTLGISSPWNDVHRTVLEKRGNSRAVLSSESFWGLLYACYPRSLARTVRWQLGSNMFSDVSADGRPLVTCV